MLMLANLLALTLIAADTPMPKISPPRVSDNPQADEIWNLSLPEAIRIGLDNSQVVRVFGPADAANGSGLVIGRLNTNSSASQFKANVMAQVRSIEQTYWALSFQQTVLGSRETAVKLAEEILRRERDRMEFSRGGNADIAEAEQQLENFRLNLVSATSDVIISERTLRNLIGLPAADNRRIVTATAPNRVRIEPDLKESLALMMAKNPVIAEQHILMHRSATDVRNNEPTSAQMIKQKEVLDQIVHETTHELARFTLEIDANHKLFQAAGKLRTAAELRLKAQQAFYAEGRVTLDRLLDAVSRCADAIAQESQYLAYYNTSIAAFEEARGTLLTDEGITIAECVSTKDKPPADVKPTPAAFDPPAATTTYKLRAKVGGKTVIEVEVEVQETKKPAQARDGS